MEALYVLALMSLFAGLWFGVSWLIAQFGWRALARSYRTTKEAPSEMHNFCTGSINWFANYRVALRVGLTQDGVYLSVWPVFRIGHPPLLIPYRDITPAERSNSFFREMAIGNPAVAHLSLSTQMVKKIEERMNAVLK